MHSQSKLVLSLLLLSTACQRNFNLDSKLDSYAPEDGRFLIKAVHSGLCLDVPNASVANGTLVQQFPCNGSNAQIFQLQKQQDGSFMILNFNRSSALDIKNVSKEKGALLQIWAPSASANQRFELEFAGHDEYRIRSVLSDLVLDVDDQSKDPGAKILQWTETGNPNQRFLLERVKESDWQLVWHDEFDGNSIDRSKWAFDVKKPGWVNHELQNYTDGRPENARVENGQLIIEARKDNFEGEKFSSARLKTEGKASWTYGRFEARIQLPKGLGTWPAFWMMPDNQSRGWPACGEIDIMEHVGYQQDFIHATTHSATYSWLSAKQRTAETLVSGVSDGFHVYAVEWSKDGIDAYVDGRKYYTSPNDGTGDDAYPFNKNFHIIMNLAVGGDWGGVKGVDENIWPQQMRVDYVRVYQKQ